MAIVQRDILFDKIIDISFYLTSEQQTANVFAFDNIKCPATGRKPQISIKGTLFGNSNMSEIEVVITNFYPSKSLSQYKKMTIKAGYKNGAYTVISGQVWASYVQKPPPDSETVFTMIVGDFTTYNNINESTEYMYNNNFDKGTNATTIIKDIANKWGTMIKGTIAVSYLPATLEAEIVGNIDYNIPTSMAFSHITISDAIKKIVQAFPNKLLIRPDGNTLYITDYTKTSEQTRELEYITEAQNNIGSFTITAPWIPTIRPNDKVRANPKYFTQPMGAMFINNTYFKVITVDFSFDTCGSENQMILQCVPL